MHSYTLFAQEDLSGSWQGAIKISGIELKIEVHFQKKTDSLTAHIDIPQQGAKGLPLQNVTYNHPKVYFELSAGPGLAKFEGEKQGERISGTFTQGAGSGTFEIKRTGEEEAQPVLAYRAEEVKVENGEVTLAGTLTLPKKTGKHPALIMITGSGPQDRNEEIYGFKAFEIMADYLTRQGVAVLRYDDRGVFGSTGDFQAATSEDFAQDAQAAIRYLKSRPEIDSQQIGIYGHSEGGAIAPQVAVENPSVAFIILGAGYGVPGAEVSLYQNELMMQQLGVNQDYIVQVNALNRMAYETAQKNEGWEALEAKFQEVTPTANIQTQIQQLKSPWFRYYVTYNPAIPLSKVTCPVLVLFGEKDLQVAPEQNKEPIESALKKGGNNDYTVKVFEDANHLFQKANTGMPTEYPQLEKAFVPDFLSYVSAWLLERVEVVK